MMSYTHYILQQYISLIYFRPSSFDLRLQFVADAVQHSSTLREKVYDDISWNKDHPVLLRIKRRFEPVSTKVSKH